MEIQLLHESAKIPNKLYPGSSCYSIYSYRWYILEKDTTATIETKIAIDIPEGYIGIITLDNRFVEHKGLELVDGPIIIEPTDHEPITLKIHNTANKRRDIRLFRPIARLAIIPVIDTEFVQVDELQPVKRK